MKPPQASGRRGGLGSGAARLAVVLMLGATLLGTAPAASAEDLTFTPTDDATIREAQPTKSTGGAVRLIVDGRPRRDALLRFAVTGVDDRGGTGARLRLHVRDSSNRGGSLAGTSTSDWSQRTVNWQNAPAGGPEVASLGPVAAGSWYEFDVTSLVDADGIVSVRISSPSADEVNFSSKEAGASLAPRLVVTVADASSDVSAPTVPGDLRETAADSSAVGLAWDASSDDTGVAGYEVTRNGVPVATTSPTVTSHLDQGLDPSTSYDYAVRAFDAAGNNSAYTNDLQVTTAAAGGDPVLVGAGDIATCEGTGDEDTAVLLDRIPGTVFTTGDTAYPDGTVQQFAECYDPSWGRHKSRTRSAVGNHEYHMPGAAPYFDYFGVDSAGEPGKGYYSYDVGTWHLVVLNSNCEEVVGGCAAGSPQEQWLRADLAATSRENIGAFWHAPWRTSGARGSAVAMTPMWQALYDHGADFAAVGHDHFYERFAPLDPVGNLDTAYGIRSFVVGTGGAPLRSVTTRIEHSEEFARAHGVLKLTLRADSYDWEFVPTPAFTFADSGTSTVHDAPDPDVQPPSPPADLTATPVDERQVDLSWSAATDNVAVVGYQLERDGDDLVTLGDALTYSDGTVEPGQLYSYRVRARDTAGNWSAWSEPVEVTTPGTPSILIDVEEDAFIMPSTPDRNYRGRVNWGVDASAVMDSMLKLEVGDLDGRTISSARLRIRCTNGSNRGGEFFAAPGTWAERTVTWNTAPAATGAALDSVGRVVRGTEYAVDLTGFVTGEGTYSLRASSVSDNGANYASSESTDGAGPVLELTLAPAP